jgi:hypothetical protein
MLGAVMMSAAMLSGCGGDKANDPVSVAKAALPVAVQTMVDAPFAADGEIHLQARGVFVVKADTMFCRDPNGFGVDTDQLKQLFRRLEQPESLQGGSFFRGNCQMSRDAKYATPNPIFVSGSQTPNRNGTPYKLVLAVWQGDVAKGGAVWVGAVERLEGGPRPKIFDPYGTGALPYEIGADAKALSEVFIKQLTGAR